MTTEPPQSLNEAACGQSRAGEAGANLTDVLERLIEKAGFDTGFQRIFVENNSEKFFRLVEAVRLAEREAAGHGKLTGRARCPTRKVRGEDAEGDPVNGANES